MIRPCSWASYSKSLGIMLTSSPDCLSRASNANCCYFDSSWIFATKITIICTEYVCQHLNIYEFVYLLFLFSTVTSDLAFVFRIFRIPAHMIFLIIFPILICVKWYPQVITLDLCTMPHIIILKPCCVFSGILGQLDIYWLIITVWFYSLIPALVASITALLFAFHALTVIIHASFFGFTLQSVELTLFKRWCTSFCIFLVHSVSSVIFITLNGSRFSCILYPFLITLFCFWA